RLRRLLGPASARIRFASSVEAGRRDCAGRRAPANPRAPARRAPGRARADSASELATELGFACRGHPALLLDLGELALELGAHRRLLGLGRGLGFLLQAAQDLALALELLLQPLHGLALRYQRRPARAFRAQEELLGEV